MKLQILSDLHNEFLIPGNEAVNHAWNGVIPDTDTDLVVLAGDIDIGVCGAEWAIEESKRLSKDIVYVLGNHEFYRQEFHGLKSKIRRLCEGTRVHFLDREVMTVGDVRLLGATLWTDYKINPALPQALSMQHAEQHLNDHHLIRFKTGNRYPTFKTRDALNQHNKERNWMLDQLNQPWHGKTVIVTHHGPHPVCEHPAFPMNELTGAFHSDLSSLIGDFEIDLWVFGHTHSNVDTTVSGTRIFSNQAGYPGEGVRGFEPKLVVNI